MTLITLTAAQIAQVTRAKIANVEANWPHILSAMDWAKMNVPLVQVGMAATIAAETSQFLPVREILTKNPNTNLYRLQQRYAKTGFFGRGYIQITWEKNYRAAGEFIGVDLIKEPDLALDPKIAAMIAAWFFKVNNIDKQCLRGEWRMVRKLVNGPRYFENVTGLAKFLNHCETLQKLVQP